ncbi:hypothetical protein V6N13_098843 [Hibiscus sabdariffa]|uniref:RNase H type-1 domain-containing protein n=1 Tax=Hibiscus sabdariffa TaxID=183260 RepID=A0ABR2EF44_9ROSI
MLTPLSTSTSFGSVADLLRDQIGPISLVRAIAALRQKAWATEFTWIPRASNLSVDMLAKSVDPSSTDFHELAEPPAALMSLLSMDALHLSL